MPQDPTKTGMLFAPLPRQRRLQLRISERRLLLMAGDVMCVIGSVLLSLLIWASVAKSPVTPQFFIEQTIWFVLLPGLWLLLANANDFYDLKRASQRGATLLRLVEITGQLLIVYLIVFFLSPREALPRLFILYYGISSTALIALWRLTNPALVGWAAEARHVLIVGADWAARELIRAIHSGSNQEVRVVGIIGEETQVGESLEGVPVIGTAQDLMTFVRRDRVREIVLTSAGDLSGTVFQAVMDAYQAGVSVITMPVLYERITGRVPVEHVGSNWTVVLPLESGDASNPYPLIKRLGEIFLALTGLLVLLLILPLIALVIYIDSPGPIFYGQQRVGLNGRLFKIYKLRSMIPDAERASGARFSEKHDPRHTRVGRFLRKTRLDELPQLWNILRGDMSLIGPRPERPEHVERLQAKVPFYRTRLVVRPGLTGWAQVRFGYGATDEDQVIKLQYDLYYIRHRSLLLDANILMQTVGRVLKMGGV